MNFVGTIFIVALGAILAFAVEDPGGSLDVSIVGWILMATGAVLLRLQWVAMSPTRRMTGVVPAIREWRVSDERRPRVVVRAPRRRVSRPARVERRGRGSVEGAPRRWDEFDDPA